MVEGGGWRVAKQDLTEGLDLLGKLGAGGELHLLTQGGNNLCLLFLGGTLGTFLDGLCGEALVVSLADDLTDILQVLHHQQRVLGQERQERLTAFHLARQFRDDVNLLAAVTRQLVFHLKSAEGVNVIAKEIDSERIFTAEREHIENAATKGKLTGLIDVIHLTEAQFTQSGANRIHIDMLSGLEAERTVVKAFLRDNELCHCFGIGYNI